MLFISPALDHSNIDQFVLVCDFFLRNPILCKFKIYGSLFLNFYTFNFAYFLYTHSDLESIK